MEFVSEPYTLTRPLHDRASLDRACHRVTLGTTHRAARLPAARSGGAIQRSLWAQGQVCLLPGGKIKHLPG